MKSMVSPDAQRADLQRIPRLRAKRQAHPPGSLAAALSGQPGGIFSAPAHPFDERTGSGIRWSPSALELWVRDERLDVAELATESPSACWRDLAFVGAFPTVSHWWLGSAWTQRVRVTTMARLPDRSGLAWLQAVQEDADELPWSVGADGMADGPLPEYSGGALNMPLRMRLGQLVRLVLAGEIRVDQWAAVTSLVAARELHTLVTIERRDELLSAVGLL